MAASTEGTAMTKDHLTSFGYRWVGLMCALLMSLMVAGCGGGGGGSNGDVNAPSEFTVTPTEIKTGPNTVWTFTLSGGLRPYRAKSSSSLVVLDKENLALNEFTVSARTLDPNGEAIVTVAFFDVNGKTKTATVTINSATTSTLRALPATLTVYRNTPALVAASGGLPPYRILSSNPAIIPTSSWSQSGDFLILPRDVAAELEVSLTMQDSSGQSAPITVTVRPAPLLNVFTITPVPATPGVGCGTAVCSGQDATASVTLRSFEGAPLPGRQVRFDVVQGEYLFHSDNPAQPLVTSYTATSDQNGLAVVRFKANVNAVTAAALIRATDLLTGNRVDGSFVIAQYTDGTGTLTALPSAINFGWWWDDGCSYGYSANIYIFGGTPPYRVVDAFPGSLVLAGNPVQTNGGAVTITTQGHCLDPGMLIITDATARTISVAVTAKPGEHERDGGFSPTPMAVTPDAASIKCGESANFLVTGGATNSVLVSTAVPQLRATVAEKTVTVTMNSNISGPATVEVTDGANRVPLTITSAGCQ